jgi:hypothetical protein
MARKPSREEVELRAYEIYIERGAEDGHDAEDWVAAEEELTNRLASERQHETSAPNSLHRTATASGGDRR